MAEFKYFGITVMNKNCIHEEIRSRLNLGNACYHFVQSFFSHLSKNLKINLYKTIISPLVLYVCETLSLSLMEEHRLRVFENRC